MQIDILRIKILLPFTIIILGFSYIFYEWLNTESTDNAYIEGTITNISAEINGVIKEVYVKDNQKVKKDQILAKIDDSEYKLNSEISENIYKQQRMNVEILENKVSIAKKNLKKAHENNEFALSNLENKKKEFLRTEKLSKDNFISKKIFEDSKLSYEKAENEQMITSKQLGIAKIDLNTLEIEHALSMLNLENAKKNLELSKIKLSKTEIISPYSGTLANNNLKIGRYVVPAMSLVSISDDNDLYIKANFKETQINSLNIDQKVNIHFDSINKSFEGVVRSIYPATGSKFSLIPSDNATGNFTKIIQRVPVIIDFKIDKSQMEKLKIGMSVEVSYKK